LVNRLGEFSFRSPSYVAGSRYPEIQVWGQRVYIGDGATSEIRVMRPDGRLTHIIRSADVPRRITPEDVERVLRGAAPVYRTEWRPDTYPTYMGFRVDPDGRLWVQDYTFPLLPDRVGWTAFDVNGRLMGRLEVPRRMGDRSASVTGLGSNEVLVWETDSDGFVHLVFYPLVMLKP
jgi:hypothetical protein